jgi:hypothetical protein
LSSAVTPAAVALAVCTGFYKSDVRSEAVTSIDTAAPVISRNEALKLFEQTEV